MLTMLRSAPVGRYLQPIGNWNDGLDLPFVFVREELYIKVSLGQIVLNDPSLESSLEGATLTLQHGDTSVTCNEDVWYQKRNPYKEKVLFASQELGMLRIRVKGTINATAEYDLANQSLTQPNADIQSEIDDPEFRSTFENSPISDVPNFANQAQTLRLCCDLFPESICIDGILDGNSVLGTIQCTVAVYTSESLSLPEPAHPLSQHTGGRRAVEPHIIGRGGCCSRSRRWGPARTQALAAYESIYPQPVDTWKAPGSSGPVDETAAPPVSRVTCIYGALTHPKCLDILIVEIDILGLDVHRRKLSSAVVSYS